MTDKQLQNLVTQFREGALGTPARFGVDPEEANRAHDRMHAAYKAMRATPEGREAICKLMWDPDPDVRSSAAARSLHWRPDEARKVLEQLVEQGGLLGFEAEMTLKEYDKGRLTFDY